ncbi:MAG: GntR family transcriptional regulator [Thermoflavifilum sp.]|nr:GntR family transcriptional regulator [Thermoflavifilum sp.]MCL6514751.1 GntR family transcriptional regulator [Alicyclobacillus sp.]
MQFSAFMTVRGEEDEIGKSLPMRIAEYIARGILEGRFATGERLKEEELAATFNTSRSPVREALYMLQLEGLVERLPRRGTVVKAYTQKELRELYEVRLGLEAMAMDRLVQRWTPQVERRFRRVLQDMEEALASVDAEAYARLNDDFHQLIFEHADNSVLWRMYRQLKNLLIAVLQLSTQDVEQMRMSLEEHRGIVDVLASGRFDEAKALLLENVRHGMDRALRTR